MGNSDRKGDDPVATSKRLECGCHFDSSSSNNRASGKVETFVKTVIEAASGSSCPTSPSPTPSQSNTSRLSPRSLPVVEEMLGSLSNLPSVESTRGNKTVSARGSKKSVVSKVGTNLKNISSKSKETTKCHRQNLLVKRNDSPLKSLTPGDLGKVRAQSQQNTVINPIHSGDVLVIESDAEPPATSPVSEEHLSTFYLQKPISTYAKRESSAKKKSSCAVEKALPANPSIKSSKPPASPPSAEIKNVESDQHPVGLDQGTDDAVKNQTRELEKVCVHHYHHHSHHHHHHYYDSFREHQQHPDLSERPEEELRSAASPDLPSPHDIHGISFYRKFSATSPMMRSKSSLAWPLSSADLKNNVLPGYCSKTSDKVKSRSTPIKLDIMATSHFPHFFEYGCVCGTFCYYCCQEVSCSCACDDCCCRRQMSHLTKSPVSGRENGRARSKSLESLVTSNKDDKLIEDLDLDELILDDPDTFINNHLLHHLQLSPESDEDNFNLVDVCIGGSPALDENTEEEIHQSEHSRHDKLGDNEDNNETLEESTQTKSGSSEHNKLETRIQVITDDNEKMGFISEKDEAADENKEEQEKVSRTGALSPFSRSTTSIVIVKKETPSPRSSRRSNPRSRSRLRVANGEIRPSPIDDGLRSSSSRRFATPEPVIVSESRSFSSGGNRLTVTMDSMSLFLDAVHVHMRHGFESP